LVILPILLRKLSFAASSLSISDRKLATCATQVVRPFAILGVLLARVQCQRQASADLPDELTNRACLAMKMGYNAIQIVPAGFSQRPLKSSNE
jgi:hypothetical protein